MDAAIRALRFHVDAAGEGHGREGSLPGGVDEESLASFVVRVD
jgi:hypothetical protein